MPRQYDTGSISLKFQVFFLFFFIINLHTPNGFLNPWPYPPTILMEGGNAIWCQWGGEIPWYQWAQHKYSRSMQRKATIDSGNEKHNYKINKWRNIGWESDTQISNKVYKSVTLLSSTDHSTPQNNMSAFPNICNEKNY